MIRADGLTATATGGPRVDAATFGAARGETVGIVGTTRSGSALLLQLLATLVTPAAGRLVIGGIDAIASPFDARRLLFWAGTPVMEADLSVSDYFTLVRRGRRVAGTRVVRDTAHDTVLEDAGVSPTRRLQELPPGQRRLVDLVVAARSGAGLLLLDRPSRGLGAAELLVATRVLDGARAAGATVLMTADASLELPTRCDRLLAMEKGRLTAMPPGPGAGTASPASLDWSAR